ncbi:MAG: SDR family NAD(P)-dependent oxidoreductase [Proteobacteria bacterium]|nr:SDR family NAD(P)-dependent oxidoreductase [Pseudomonadota bacterium]
MHDHTYKIAAVTGATGAIGKAIAKGIAQNPEFEVILICRNESKAKACVADIQNQTGNNKVRYELADLSSFSSIQALSKRWTGSLHVLVNNAAITPVRRMETAEGIELQFATNVLGYFWMMQSFSDQLKRSAPSRVANVASYWAGDLDMDDLEFRRRRYENNTAYRQSKQADRMLTVAFADRFKSHGVSVNACHPGDVNSTLSNSLGFGGHETPDQGSDTPVLLATNPVGIKQTGCYFEHGRQAHCRFGQDRNMVEDLYDLCMTY